MACRAHTVHAGTGFYFIFVYRFALALQLGDMTFKVIPRRQLDNHEYQHADDQQRGYHRQYTAQNIEKH
jgi:hypothetical protein